MDFVVIDNDQRIMPDAPDTAYLWTDNWNDYWDYKTLYVLNYIDEAGEHHRIGEVKIGQFDWQDGQRRPNVPDSFETLDVPFFSLGQDVGYYENLRGISPDFCELVLTALNDVAADDELFQRARNESVMGVSLMRSVNERTISGQYRRIIDGGVSLTNFHFDYRGPQQLDPNFDPVELSFSVQPGSKPPTNIQVIIGRNGVGKSFLMNHMSRALVHPDEDTLENGEFFDADDFLEDEFESPFANVLSVTFSAFDDFPIIRQNRNALQGVRYDNIGLRKLKKETDDEGNAKLFTITQKPVELASDFIASAKICVRGERAFRWRQAIRTLEADPIFETARVTDLLDLEPEDIARPAGKLFRRLSSGHKIVLLTVTKLVEKVDERTLVIMDEPEAHLHPPLLAALIRALSDLLINRNGVAVIATHSPVVLQEVPRSCVWKMRRYDGASVVERPERETFAEHVGVLTHEVFGLEVTRSGFHKMLADAVDENDDLDDVVAKFDHEIGSEGRALISSLVALRNAQELD